MEGVRLSTSSCTATGPERGRECAGDPEQWAPCKVGGSDGSDAAALAPTCRHPVLGVPAPPRPGFPFGALMFPTGLGAGVPHAAAAPRRRGGELEGCRAQLGRDPGSSALQPGLDGAR